jgi:SNF2 family DNA or RNA helicase
MSKSTTTEKQPSKRFEPQWSLRAPGGVGGKSAQPAQPPAPPRPWKPRAFQKKAMKFLLEHRCAALFLDPGLGKTSSTYGAFKVLKKQKMVTGMLVVAPLRPCRTVWPKEQRKWIDFKYLDVVTLRGPERDKLVREQHDVYLINYENLDYLFERAHPLKRDGTPNLKEWRYRLTAAGKALLAHVQILVWDELSKMKHPDTLRYKLIEPHIRKFEWRWGLTGSPASNGLLDLFGQCYVLDEGRTLGQYITFYKSEYFRQLDVYGRTLALLPGADKRIYKRLRPLALRMEAEDYMELPVEMVHPVKLDLPEKARAHYEELERDLITRIDRELIVAVNKAVTNGKCRQICSGAIWLADVDPVTGALRGSDRTWKEVHTVKLDALEELMEELQGQQLLIAYDFNHDIQRMLKRWPKMPYIGGGVSEKRGEELEAEWNVGNLQYLAGHPASIAHGLNLQESSAYNIAYFTLPWDFELYDQFNRRLRRQGNTAKHLNIYPFIMRDSVEESVMYALKRKYKTQKELLDALKGRARLDDENLGD